MIYTLTSLQDKDLEDFYINSFRELDEFYELNWTQFKPNIFIISSDEEYKAIRNNMSLGSFRRATGWIGNGNVYVVNKVMYSEMMGKDYLDERYLKLIKHELSHCFYQHVSQVYSKNRPDWLWEGCAIYLSGQLKYMRKPIKLKNFLEHYEQRSGGEVYLESGFVINILIEKYGKAKLLELIRNISQYNSEDDFYKLFRKVYDIELNYENINSLIG